MVRSWLGEFKPESRFNVRMRVRISQATGNRAPRFSTPRHRFHEEHYLLQEKIHIPLDIRKCTPHFLGTVKLSTAPSVAMGPDVSVSDDVSHAPERSSLCHRTHVRRG